MTANTRCPRLRPELRPRRDTAVSQNSASIITCVSAASRKAQVGLPRWRMRVLEPRPALHVDAAGTDLQSKTKQWKKAHRPLVLPVAAKRWRRQHRRSCNIAALPQSMMKSFPAGDDAGFCARRPTARVVGAGPAGVLASLYLAKRGWQVDLLADIFTHELLVASVVQVQRRADSGTSNHPPTTLPRRRCTSTTSGLRRWTRAPPAGITTSSSVRGPSGRNACSLARLAG